MELDNVEKVDVLFVVDNSNSMEQEQRALREQLPRLVTILSSGDVDQDGTNDFPPVKDLHVGVISTDMGIGTSELSCTPRGDDGVLVDRGSTMISGCQSTYSPAHLGFRPEDGGDPVMFGNDVGCLATLGLGGCGFEQQLESMLKAVTPSTSPIRFAGDTRGHADAANAGFLRDDAILAIIMVTDEDDCSAADLELFNKTNLRFGDANRLNLRCGRNTGENDGLAGGGALHPIHRFVDGLMETRRPEQVVFAAITGVPTDLANQDFSDMLTDPRMQLREDPELCATPQNCNWVPSCDRGEDSKAYPPRRLIRMADLVNARGGVGVIQSICQDDFTPALDEIIERLFETLGNPCLTRPLNPGPDGAVDCDILELLPEGLRCDPSRGRETIGTEDGRDLCRVAQVPSREGAGWFYDTTSEDVLVTCRDNPQRISFVSGFEAQNGAQIRLQCKLPVQSSSGEATFGSVCMGEPDDFCQSSSVEQLSCNPATRTCERSCTNDASCPDGWACDPTAGNICAVPTCN